MATFNEIKNILDAANITYVLDTSYEDLMIVNFPNRSMRQTSWMHEGHDLNNAIKVLAKRGIVPCDVETDTDFTDSIDHTQEIHNDHGVPVQYGNVPTHCIEFTSENEAHDDFGTINTLDRTVNGLRMQIENPIFGK